MTFCPKCGSSNTIEESDDGDGLNHRFRNCLECGYYVDESNREKDLVDSLRRKRSIYRRYEEAGGDTELERILSLPTNEEKLIKLAKFVRRAEGLPPDTRIKFPQIGSLYYLANKYDPITKSIKLD